jgi:hypothetical protein
VPTSHPVLNLCAIFRFFGVFMSTMTNHIRYRHPQQIFRSHSGVHVTDRFASHPKKTLNKSESEISVEDVNSPFQKACPSHEKKNWREGGKKNRRGSTGAETSRSGRTNQLTGWDVPDPCKVTRVEGVGAYHCWTLTSRRSKTHDPSSLRACSIWIQYLSLNSWSGGYQWSRTLSVLL